MVDGRPLSHANCPMADVLATGESVRDQSVVIERPDGSRILALVDIEPLRDGAGELIGAVNVFRENSTRHRAEEAGHARTPEQALRSLPVAVYTTDAEGSIDFYNSAAAELWGTLPKLGQAESSCPWKLCRPDGAPMRTEDGPVARALRERAAVNGMEAVIERMDGSRVPVLSFANPLFDAEGTLTGVINTLVDISLTRKAELTGQRLAAIVESSDDAILSKDLDGTITTWNQGAEAMYGYTAAEAVGQPVTLIIPSDRQDEEPRILARLRRGERVRHYETVRRRKDGSLVDISLMVSAIRGPDGAIVGVSKVARDITERRRAEERQRLLLGEMNHRVKNLLVLAGSIVGLAARSAGGVQQLAADVRERLGALARAHELTLPRIPEEIGLGGPSTTLHALIHTIGAPFMGATAGQGGRVTVEGDDIGIAAGGPLTGIALLLHEFMINAAKHGALSVHEGRVMIRCSIEGERLVIVWEENGGPSVSSDPGRDSEGFGSRLVRLTLQGQLGGEIERDWQPDGLRIRVSLKRASLEA